jgi:hypothetical protein
MHHRPCFVDFESSSLTETSHPIEVAYSTPAGEIESYLIRPEPGWVDWSEFAEHHIHGISVAELHEWGAPPAQVAARMNDVLAGQPVLTLSPAFDTRLLNRLMDAVAFTPTFRLSSFYKAVAEHAARERLAQASAWARAHAPNHPRAANGVTYLLAFWHRALPEE